MSKFYYKNVHINLGNVRWYSTSNSSNTNVYFIFYTEKKIISLSLALAIILPLLYLIKQSLYISGELNPVPYPDTHNLLPKLEKLVGVVKTRTILFFMWYY